MGWPAAALAAVSAFVRQHGQKKAVEKFGIKRVRQAVEKKIKDKPSGSGRTITKESTRRDLKKQKAFEDYGDSGLLKGKAAKKKAAEFELDQIIPPMRFRKKGGLIKKSSPKKSIDGIARKGKTKAKHR